MSVICTTSRNVAYEALWPTSHVAIAALQPRCCFRIDRHSTWN